MDGLKRAKKNNNMSGLGMKMLGGNELYNPWQGVALEDYIQPTIIP
jgi:hypothetical protein